MKIKHCTVCYLQKDDEILMLYRNKKKNDINEGKWIGVGGHIENYESPYECAIREIKEETGYTAHSLVLRGIMTFILKNEDLVEYLYIFSTRDYSGDMIDCNEGELKYIHKNNISSLNLWQSDRFFMDRIINDDYNFFMIKSIYENSELIEEIREII